MKIANRIIICILIIAVLFFAVISTHPKKETQQENIDMSKFVHPPREEKSPLRQSPIHFVEKSENDKIKEISKEIYETAENEVEEIKVSGLFDNAVELEATDSDQERGVYFDEENHPKEKSELEMLACTIYQEAGADYFSDETRYMVGDVVLNRIASEQFPDTMKGVLVEKGQYGEFFSTGVVWPARASDKLEDKAVNRAYDIAYDLLNDIKHSSLFQNGYIWQAEFPQGTEWIYQDGLYFGR